MEGEVEGEAEGKWKVEGEGEAEVGRGEVRCGGGGRKDEAVTNFP